MFRSVLSQTAQTALALLGEKNFLPPKTYLAGGSSLTLQFGHRVSEDFDFFTPTHFKVSEVQKELEKNGKFVVQHSEERDTLLGSFNNVKFSLFLYEYPLVHKAINFAGIALARPEDIAAMKLAAIMDRGTKKDFVDLFFLIKKGFTIEKALSYYDKKYKLLEGNLYSIMKSLSYFDEAEISDMPVMIEKVSWQEVKKFMQKEFVRLAKIYLN